MTTRVTAFDKAERRAWAGRARAFAGSFAALCAHTVPALLDAAGVREGVRVLDVGTGTGNAAAAATGRGAVVTAVDADPGMAALAARAAPGARVGVAALPRLPFRDGAFDAVVANFVLNHVGRPRAALTELRRVARPGGRVAVTIWAAPAAAGQALLGRAVQAAGVTRPAHLPVLDPRDDFPRTERGFAALLDGAGLTGTVCRTLVWEHRATVGEWWSGPAAGVATVGQIVAALAPARAAEVERHFRLLSREFAAPDGEAGGEDVLLLPHAALLAHGRA